MKTVKLNKFPDLVLISGQRESFPNEHIVSGDTDTRRYDSVLIQLVVDGRPHTWEREDMC